MSTAVIHGMTVDLERWFDTEAVRGRPRGILPPSRLRDSTLRTAELLARHGVLATWFVVGAAAEEDPALIRELDAAGHEIGCHGYTHRPTHELGPRAWQSELRATKSLLEDILGKPVTAHRSPSWSVRNGTLWALRAVADCHFLYDASLCPAPTPGWGVPGVPTAPHRIRFPDGVELREFPLTTALLPPGLPYGGGFFLRALPQAFTVAALRHRARHGLPTVAYVHPWEIDADTPRVPLPQPWRFVHYFRHGMASRALDTLLRSSPFAPLREVAAGIDWSAAPVWNCPAAE